MIINQHFLNVKKSLVKSLIMFLILLILFIKGPIGIKSAKEALNNGYEVCLEEGLKLEEKLYHNVCIS